MRLLLSLLLTSRRGFTDKIAGCECLAQIGRRPQIYIDIALGKYLQGPRDLFQIHHIPMHSSSGHQVDSAPKNAGNSTHETRRRIAFRLKASLLELELHIDPQWHSVLFGLSCMHCRRVQDTDDSDAECNLV